MFEPELSLSGEIDGEFTLNSLLLTPNSCHSGGGYDLNPPPGQVLVPEAQPVTLHVYRTGQFCLQAITPVRHVVPNLRLGVAYAKTSIVAFSLIHDLDTGQSFIGGTSRIQVPDEARTTVITSETRELLNGEQWHATANLKPPAPFTLYVHGKVTVPNPGHKVRLVRADVQGINPRQLILDLKIDRLPGIWPQQITQIDATYHDSAYPDDSFDTVHIRGSGKQGWTVTVFKVR